MLTDINARKFKVFPLIFLLFLEIYLLRNISFYETLSCLSDSSHNDSVTEDQTHSNNILQKKTGY